MVQVRGATKTRNGRVSRNGRLPKQRNESAIRKALARPVRSVPLAFLAVIIVGAALLILPLARTGSEPGAG